MEKWYWNKALEVKMKIKISKSQWQKIGKENGWDKTAQTNIPSVDPQQKSDTFKDLQEKVREEDNQMDRIAKMIVDVLTGEEGEKDKFLMILVDALGGDPNVLEQMIDDTYYQEPF